MKNRVKRIVPLAALAIILVSIAPMAYASTLTVNLNPKTGLAEVNSVSTTKIVFTYPSGSAISNYLKSESSSLALKGSFDGSTSGVHELQSTFDDEDSHVSVKNMSVALDYTAKGNTTALVVDKKTNVTAWVSGVFSIVNGSVTADLGWRAFVIRGALNLPLEDHSVDINLVGSTMQDSVSDHATAAGFLSNAFGSGSLWNRPTLNFSALNTPLSAWTKSYNSATNTTTFSKTISGQSTFTASVDYNGQKYSLSAVSDPSGVVNVKGYANAVGNSLVMTQAPPSAPTSLLAAGVVVVALAVGVGYFAFRTRARARATTSASTTLPV